MLKNIFFLILILSHVTTTSLTSHEKQKKDKDKQPDTDIDAILASNIDSRYPTWSWENKKPKLIQALDRAKLTDLHVTPMTTNAEIVSPVSPKKIPNFSKPLKRSDAYESVTGRILKEYLKDSE